MIYAIIALIASVCALCAIAIFQGSAIVKLRGQLEDIDVMQSALSEGLVRLESKFEAPVRHVPRPQPKKPRTMTEWREMSEAEAMKDS